MNKFTITIEAPALAEAIEHLAGAIKDRGRTEEPQALVQRENTQAPAGMQEVMPTSNVTPVAPTAAPVAPAVPAAPAAAPVTLTAPAAPVVEPASAPAPVKKYTLDDLATASAALIDAGKMQAIMQIIQKYGVPAINLLRPDQYEAFAADLRGIGGQI